MKEKSYILTPEQEAEVAKVLAEGKEKYKDIAHIIIESPGFTDEEIKAFGWDEFDNE